MGKEPSFAVAYDAGAKRFANTKAAKQILSSLPSQAMQTLAMGFAIDLVLIMLAVHGSVVELRTLLAIYAYAIQKLRPNTKTIFRQLSTIKYYGHMGESLYRNMTGMPGPPDTSDRTAMKARPERLQFNETITLQDVSFAYPSADETVLHSINLSIAKNNTVGANTAFWHSRGIAGHECGRATRAHHESS